MKAKIAVLTLLILFFNLLGPLPRIALADTLALAKLAEVKGEVWVHRGGGLQELSAYNGMGLYQGDTLRTGASGSVKISYGDGTETTVGANTLLTMQKLSSATSVSQAGLMRISASSSKKIGIFLWTGSIWNKVKSLLNADDQYEVETPTAIIGVRGTLYLVSVNQESGATTGDVLDGTVAFQQNRERTDSGREQLVSMGEELEVYSLDAPLPKQIEINGQKLIEKTQPTIIVALITDIVDRVSEIKEKTKAAQIDFGKTKDTGALKNALVLAEKASKLSDLSKGITEKAASSNKVEQIKEVLKQQNKTLEQVQTQVEQIKQEAEQTRVEVVDTAKDAGLSEEEIEDIVEEAVKPVTPAAPEENNPSGPNTGDSGDSGDSDDGGDVSTPSENTVSFSLQLDQEIQAAKINKDGIWAPVITTDQGQYWIGLDVHCPSNLWFKY